MSYGYIFGQSRELFDAFVRRSWTTPHSLYSHTEATVALDGSELLGIEIGYDGKRTYELKAEAGTVALALLDSGEANEAHLRHVADAAAKNEFQLPLIPSTAYYVMALAVTEASRGRGVGARLLHGAFDRARKAGYRSVHLDVLSDNPAVGFYEAMGMTCMAETSVPELRDKHRIPMERRMVKEL